MLVQDIGDTSLRTAPRVYKLKARYEAEGNTASEPRSRRPQTTGELLRELVLDTSKRYQGTGRPPGSTG